MILLKTQANISFGELQFNMGNSIISLSSCLYSPFQTHGAVLEAHVFILGVQFLSASVPL